MARLAEIKEGDVVLDPLIVEGTVLYECMQVCPKAKFFGGDSEDQFLDSFQKWVTKKQLDNVQVFKWDLRTLSHATGSVDVVITDLPFARRSHSVIKAHERGYSFVFR